MFESFSFLASLKKPLLRECVGILTLSRSILFLLSLLVFLPAGALAAKADTKRDFSRATELMRLGKESEALVSLTDFLRRYPKDSQAVEAQFLIGEVEYRRRNFEGAIRELKKTLKYKGKGNAVIADAYFLIGQCWYLMGRKERAFIEWQALIRSFPNAPAASKAKGKLYELGVEN